MRNISNRSGTRAVALAPPASRVLSVFLSGVFDRLAALANSYLRAREERRRALETVRCLAALSNRELKDIGVNRSEILSLAYGPSDGRRVRNHGHD